MAMNMLDAGAITFEKTPSGVLNAMYRGAERHENVRCAPLFPHSPGAGYISILIKKEKEYIELGIIRDASAFPADQRRLIEDDIAFRYFVPEITDITKISGKHGMDEWVIQTDRGGRTIQVRDRKENVLLTDKGVIFVTDSDACRYRISDVRRLPPRAQDLLEKQLV
jgi:hypothetical protein